MLSKEERVALLTQAIGDSVKDLIDQSVPPSAVDGGSPTTQHTTGDYVLDGGRP